MIIKALELTHFGGLAKVLIQQPIENGVSQSLDTRYALTMQYSTAELKICKMEQRTDSETGLRYSEISEYPVIDFVLDHPFGSFREFIAWRTSIWNLAVFRSLEIWKTLPLEKIERSLGELSADAKMSLKGKLGAGNMRYFEKDKNGNWVYNKFKETKYENIFKPFDENAIKLCKIRARAKNGISKH